MDGEWEILPDGFFWSWLLMLPPPNCNSCPMEWNKEEDPHLNLNVHKDKEVRN
jgi:hypothetical protein